MKFPQYNPQLDNPPLGDAELDQLDALLAELPGDESMDIEGLDGYLTALLLAPELPPADDWVPRVWGGTQGEPAPFTSGKQAKRIGQLLLRHMATIDRQLHRDVEALEPFFAAADCDEVEDVDVAPQDVPEDGQWVDAGNWCVGFLIATELLPAAWQSLFDSDEGAALLEPIVLLGSDPESLDESQRERLEDLVERDHLSRQVPDVVTELWRRRGLSGHTTAA